MNMVANNQKQMAFSYNFTNNSITASKGQQLPEMPV